SPDTEIPEHETSILADPQSSDVDTRTISDGHSRTSSEDHFAKVPFFDETSNASPRILIRGSNFSEIGSSHGWEEIDKQSNGTSDDQCREVRCIETEKSSNRGAIESNNPSPEKQTVFPKIKVPVSGNEQTMESPLPPSEKDQEFLSSALKNDDEMKEATVSGRVLEEDQ
ncbi:hypothetical protein ABTG41_01180, partial [Acinetobacter baumannii]